MNVRMIPLLAMLAIPQPACKGAHNAAIEIGGMLVGARGTGEVAAHHVINRCKNDSRVNEEAKRCLLANLQKGAEPWQCEGVDSFTCGSGFKDEIRSAITALDSE